MRLILMTFMAAIVAAPGNPARQVPYEETQAGMNQAAAQEFQTAETEMSKVLERLFKKAAGKPDALAKLHRAQEAWKAYRDAQVEAMWPFPERAQYGSVYPMCLATERTTLTKARILELRAMLAPVEGDVCSSQWPE